MFSGIVEELGKIRKISRRGALTVFEIEARIALEETKIGDSIAVNGACLTVVSVLKDAFIFEAMPETLRSSALGVLAINDKVNLERSLKVGDRISGHFISGHVDCAGVIRRKLQKNGNLCFEIAVANEFMKFLLPKGSVSVDGISLTVMEKRAPTFGVYIIPHTLRNTTLSFKGPSDKVNVEFDILAKKY